MAMKWRNKVVLAKKESTYGTDPTPTKDNNAILLRSAELAPIASSEVSRNLEGRGLGNQAKMLTDIHATLNCSVEMASSGAAGTAPAWGPLLEACGFASTVANNTSVTYKPKSTGNASLTIYFYLDGILHTLTGARGSASFSVAASEIPSIDFAFVGLFNAATSASKPTGVFTSFKTPVIPSKDNTPTFTIAGSAMVASSFSVDMGSSVIHRDLIGAKDVQITDRNATGEAVCEAKVAAIKTLLTAAKDGATKAISLVHGKDAGKKVEFSASKVQFGAITYSERDSIAMMTLPLNFIPSSGDDELTIIVK